MLWAVLVFMMTMQSEALDEPVFERAPFASCHASTIVALRNGALP